jgi:hypothetical protein
MTVNNLPPVDSSFLEIPKTENRSTEADFGKVLAQHLPQAGSFDDVFLTAGNKYNISPALLKAVASAESGFNPEAISSSGAVGLMQIMPETARQLGIDPRDPVQSIQGAASYLRTLLNQFNGNTMLAIAAYNAGPGAVARYNGIPPFKETQNYVVQVAELMKRYSSNSAGPANGSVNYAPENAGSPAISGSRSGDLADLLLIWTEAERTNALSTLNSDDASGASTTEAENEL